MVEREQVLLALGAMASITLFILIIWDAFNPQYDIPTQTIYLLLLLMSVFLGVDILRPNTGWGGGGGGSGGGGGAGGG